ncbi:hypothetical protein BSLG_004250 [Batrachochytrium salamandrivorans]|nr:hypothetical protein BSLG_004250 [Batrachochytrium salamandrivorans]
MSMSLADAIKICNVEAWLDQSLMQRLQRIGIRTDGPNLPLTTIPASCCPLPAINTPPTYMQVFDVLSADGAKICNLVGCPERCPKRSFPISNFIQLVFKRIDEMLDGGLRPCEIIEFSGLPSSGKTQVKFIHTHFSHTVASMCHLITAVTVASTLDSRVIYIDSGGSFYASRILTMLISSQYIQQFSPLCFSAFTIRYLGALLQESQRAISVGISARGSILQDEFTQSDMDGGQSTPTLLQGPACRYISDLIINIAKVLAIPIVTVNSSVSARFSDVNSDITEWKSDLDSRHGKFNVHGVDSQLRVVENIVELLDGPDKSKLGQRCQLLVSANDVFGR